MRSIIQEFKEFAVKGNMIDIAIGVIIGTAFNKVVDVLVKQIFMPPLAMITDGLSWESRKWILREGSDTIAEISIGYGKLVEVSIDFVVISMTVFIIVKFMNSLKRKADDTDDKTVETPKNIELLNRMTALL